MAAAAHVVVTTHRGAQEEAGVQVLHGHQRDAAGTAAVDAGVADR